MSADKDGYVLPLGMDEMSRVTITTRTGWRLSIEHRDEPDQPWETASGASVYLTHDEVRSLAALFHVVATATCIPAGER